MDNHIQIFSNEEFGAIRTAGTPEQPLFCLVDVARVLNLVPSKVAQRLSDDVLSKYTISDNIGRQQVTNFIKEDGLYDVILDSRKPEAKRFRKWVTSEVLPSIRKHGAYLTDAALQRVVNEPDFLIGLANAIKEERKNRLEVEAKYEEQKQLIGKQQEQIEELGKRTSYVDLVLQCKGLLDITQIAQDYGMSGRKMNAILHEKGIQYKDNKQWILYAAYKDKGYVHSATLSLESGKSVMRTQWTQKGRMFIYEKLKADGILPVMEREQSPVVNNQVTA